MKKINTKILSIPPFISTAWENVKALHFTSGALVVTLVNDTEITVPNLPADTLEDIFKAHTEYLEASKQSPATTNPKEGSKDKASLFSFDLPFNFDNFGDMGALMNCTQHDMKLSNSEPLPPELLDKIKKMAAMMGFDASKLGELKAEPHCNCPHCQVVRSINDQDDAAVTEEEEPVSDSDLKFREWDVKEIGEKRYEVTNPFDHEEKYQVFLGTPLGCTCGKKNCEHLKAVLES